MGHDMHTGRRLSLATILAVATTIVTVTAVAAQMVIPPTPYRDNTPMGGGFKNKKKKTEETKKTDYTAAQDLLAAEKFEEAIPVLLGVVANDARNDDAWHDLGYASQRLGRNTEAAGYYERALAIKPARRNTRAKLGEVYLALNNVEKAEEQLKQLTQACPDGCEELQQLQTQVATYKTAHPKT
jgi:tetratricopeptide (TPR) repeat protein